MPPRPSWPPPVVDGTWLRTALAEAAQDRAAPVRLVDLRWSLDGTQDRHSYLEGHLPGAVYADLDTDLAATPSPTGGRHPLPTPEAFAAVLGRLGIGPQDLVVAYDHGPGAIAARLVWMCRAIGQPATLLSGGLAGWDGAVESGEVVAVPVERTPVPWPRTRLADLDDVEQLRHDPAAVLIDARDPARFRGEQEPVDARPGHVPGAVNLPVAANLDPDGRLLPLEDLRARYAALGALSAEQVVVSCGSGVTACFDALALEALGVEARLFVGSWSAWSADPARPAATGPATTSPPTTSPPTTGPATTGPASADRAIPGAEG